MKEIYFDVEVACEDEEKVKSGRMPQPNPKDWKIITIQYQFLGEDKLQIFKEWESSEEEIIRKAHSLINPDTKWSLIPVGQNILFDLAFLKNRAALYGIEYSEWFIYNDLPKIDLKSILLGMNGFVFKDSGLDKFTGKESSGINIPLWYALKDYNKIVDYIQKETKEFIEFYNKLKKTLPEFRKQQGFF